MKKYCFGVDVGGTTVKVGLFTVEGQLLDKWEIITRTENNGENILFDICESLEANPKVSTLRFQFFPRI